MIEALQAAGFFAFLVVVAVFVWGFFILLFSAMTCHFAWRMLGVLERMAPPEQVRSSKARNLILAGVATCVVALIIIIGIAIWVTAPGTSPASSPAH